MLLPYLDSFSLSFTFFKALSRSFSSSELDIKSYIFSSSELESESLSLYELISDELELVRIPSTYTLMSFLILSVLFFIFFSYHFFAFFSIFFCFVINSLFFFFPIFTFHFITSSSHPTIGNSTSPFIISYFSLISTFIISIHIREQYTKWCTVFEDVITIDPHSSCSQSV